MNFYQTNWRILMAIVPPVERQWRVIFPGAVYGDGLEFGHRGFVELTAQFAHLEESDGMTTQ